MWNNEELKAQAFVERYLADAHFPLELERIAYAVEEKLGLRVYMEKVPLPNEVTAQLRTAKFAALIWVNENHSIVRQRFGVAHEFGHILMRHRDGILSPGMGESDWEYESANNFAAALLMPAWNVLCLAKKYPDSLVFLVNKTSQYFGVSMEAAARRLAATEVIPGLFTLIDPNTYRIDWEYHSPSIHLDYDAFRSFLTKQVKLPSKRREEDLDIMGYPFRVECKRMWGKLLVTCLPFTMATLVAKENAAGYAGK